MVKRSEGIRRITLSISIISVIGWIVYVGIETEGFAYTFDLLGWVIFVAGMLVMYFIPQLINRVVYWIVDGFKNDGEI